MRSKLLVAAAVVALTVAPDAAAAPLKAQSWQFAVSLDEKPIGSHHFTLSPGDGERWRLISVAEYDVRILGFSVYRYRHRAEEAWQAGCLSAFSASTDDDGQRTEIDATVREKDLVVVKRDASRPAAESVRALPNRTPPCAMTYAYWHPDLAAQRFLVDPQTGRLDEVTIALSGSAPLPVRGKTVLAQRWRLTTPLGPIDLWRDQTGDWVGLDAQVAGNRTLRYRLP